MKTLVFIHGWGTTGGVWRRQLTGLENLGVKISAPTLPTWEVPWLIDYLRALPLGQSVVVGWSLGGMLLLEALSRMGDIPGAMVLVAAPASFCQRPDYPWGQPAAAVRALRRTIRTDARRGLLDFAGRCLAPQEAVFKRDFFQEFQAGDNGPHLTAGLDYLLSADLRPSLAGIRGKCFIVQGEKDAIVPPEQAEVLRRYWNGARLVRFPQAGHAPFFTRADEFNKLVEKIVREESGS